MYSAEDFKQLEKTQKKAEAYWTRHNFICGIMSGKYRHMKIKNKQLAKRNAQ